MEFSKDAQMLMCGIFACGKGTVTSHPPHATVQKHQAAFDELISAGLVTKEPFNRFDVWTYRPTEKLAPIAGRYRPAYLEQAFAD